MEPSFKLPPFPIGLGLAALGRPTYITIGHAADIGGHPDRDALRTHTASILDDAWDLGVRYFDVARSYGMGEEFLAAWLSSNQVHPDLVVVGSKWGYTYTAAWRESATIHEVKDHSVGVLQRQLAESRINLGPHLDLYQIHSATSSSGVLHDQAVIERLWQLRDGGTGVGLTATGPDQPDTIRRALEVTRDDTQLFSTVQATWNMLEPSAGNALLEASEAGLQVIVKEAVANGRLAPGQGTLPAESLEGFPTDAVALAAAIAQPWANVVLSGAATRDQLRSNLRALEIPLSLIEALPDVSQDPEDYWAVRSALSWT